MQSDEDIRRRLLRSLRAVEPPPSRVGVAIRHGRKLRVRSRVIAVAVAFVAIFAVGAPLIVLSPLGDRSGSGTGGEGGRLVVGSRIHLDPGITDIAVGSGSVWVTGATGVTRVDAETDQVIARIRVPGTGDHSRIEVGEGSVWVIAPELRDDGSRGNLVRIDPGSNAIEATIHVGGPIMGLGIGGGSVWVTRPEEGPGTLLRIDPGTNAVVDDLRVGVSPGQPLYAHGFVWVPGNWSEGSILKIDPASGTIVDALPVGDLQSAGAGSLWRVGVDSVVRFDPVSGAVQATIAVERAQWVTVDGTTVWVLAMPRSSDPSLFYPIPGTAEVTRIDAATDRVVGEPLLLNDLQPSALSAEDSTSWVADFDSGALTRISIAPE